MVNGFLQMEPYTEVLLRVNCTSTRGWGGCSYVCAIAKGNIVGAKMKPCTVLCIFTGKNSCDYWYKGITGTLYCSL